MAGTSLGPRVFLLQQQQQQQHQQQQQNQQQQQQQQQQQAKQPSVVVRDIKLDAASENKRKKYILLPCMIPHYLS